MNRHSRQPEPGMLPAPTVNSSPLYIVSWILPGIPIAGSYRSASELSLHPGYLGAGADLNDRGKKITRRKLLPLRSAALITHD